ncbi:hypothetical protein NBRC10513_006035 [Rhodotorula toruloides]
MDGFSRADRIRAICAPLCCCWSSRVALSSPSTESLSDWFGQSRPSNSPGNGADLADTWQNAGKTDRRRDADVLSLHEGVGTGGLGQRRRFRPRGGDISGGGADTGSGLTRWTLLKSWWWGGSGAIRLTDSEDEGEELDDGEAEGVGQRDGDVVHAHEGDADAPLVTLDDVDLPPAPPSGAPEPSASSVASSSASPNLSEGTTLVDTDEDREARRAHRRARRRARELGISLEEFEQGVAVDPTELPSSPFLDIHPPSTSLSSRSRSKRSSKSSRSHASSTSSGSRRRYDREGGNGLSIVGEEEAVQVGVGTGSRLRRKERDLDDQRSHASRHSSNSQDGSSSHTSSRRTRSNRRAQETDSLDPHQVPLPLSPRPDGEYKPRHRSQPSSSTISTGTSSSRRSRRRRGEHYQHDQASPLHNPTSGDIQYYEDENGQLVAYVAEASYGGEQAAEPTSPAPPVSSSYDHIGVLPGISSRASEAGEM